MELEKEFNDLVTEPSLSVMSLVAEQHCENWKFRDLEIQR
jgi:hypothetical protein